MVPRSKSTTRIFALVPPCKSPPPPIRSTQSDSFGRHAEGFATVSVSSRDFDRRVFTRPFLPSPAAALTASDAYDIPCASDQTPTTPSSLDPHFSQLNHHHHHVSSAALTCGGPPVTEGRRYKNGTHRVSTPFSVFRQQVLPLPISVSVGHRLAATIAYAYEGTPSHARTRHARARVPRSLNESVSTQQPPIAASARARAAGLFPHVPCPLSSVRSIACVAELPRRSAARIVPGQTHSGRKLMAHRNRSFPFTT